MISVTKIFRFESAHFLPNHAGKCQNMHGHNYKLEVTFSDSVMKDGPSQGMIIDFGDLKKLINEKLIKKLDHKVINTVIDNPTAEEMLIWFVAWIMDDRLVKLKLWETDDCFAVWRKDDSK